MIKISTIYSIYQILKSMTIKTFFTGLFMALIGVVIAAFSQVPINWALTGITALAVVLGFTGGNLAGFFPSTSEPGKLNLVDLGCALLVALGTGITEYLGYIVIGQTVVWTVLLSVVGNVTLTFVASTFFSVPKSKSKRLFA
jgi:hypothetical protein